MEQLAFSIRIERRQSLVTALCVGLCWLVAALAALLVSPQSHPTLAHVAGGAAALLPPVAFALAVFTLLPPQTPEQMLGDVEVRLTDLTMLLAGLQAQLIDIDTALTESAARTRHFSSVASDVIPGLGDAATALETAAARVAASGENALNSSAALAKALPELARTLAVVDTTLRSAGTDSAAQLRAVETMIGAVQARNRIAATEADAAIALMAGLLTRIDDASARNTATLSKRAYALEAAIDGVLERSAAAVDQIREQIGLHLRVMQAGIETSGKQVVRFGDDTARLFSQRIDLLLRTSGQMLEQFAAHEAGSEQLKATVESHLDTLRERFAALGATGGAASTALRAMTEADFAQLDARLAAIRESGTAAIENIAARGKMAADRLDTQLAEIEGRFNTLQAGSAGIADLQPGVAETPPKPGH